MANQKYLLVYRQPPTDKPFQPSPEDMQKMFAQWIAWKEKFSSEIIDLGDALQPAGKVLRKAGATDGPFIEAKEVLAGYSIVQTETFERAVSISEGCPHLMTPGASIEIRPLAGY